MASRDEGTTSSFIQHIEAIIERSDEMLAQNFEGSMAVVKSMYEETKHPDTGEDFEAAAGRFKDYFDNTVFRDLIHYSAFRSDTQTFVIKSGEQLGHATQSGELDDKIGNTSYVFAYSSQLRGPSYAAGGNMYRINSRECYVVPMDIAHLHYSDEESVELYSKNIYTFEQFREMFSAYCCTVFDSPEQAVDLLASYFYYPDQADAWKPDSFRLLQDKSHEIYFQKMAMLLNEYQIVPPVSPEFQFKDEVTSTLVRNTPEDLI